MGKNTMSFCYKSAALTTAFLSLFLTVAQSFCSKAFTTMADPTSNTNCRQLGTLRAEFAWNITEAINQTRVHIIFGSPLDGEVGWLAWGVNPGKTPRMVGTRAIIGIRQQNASLVINTYNITRDVKLGCDLLPSENIDVEVLDKKIKYIEETTYLVMEATLLLPKKDYDISRLNHVWQSGQRFDGLQPKKHPANVENVDGTETIDLKTGLAFGVGEHRRRLRRVHGILNILGWGTFLPIGTIIARYFRTYPFKVKPWLSFHKGCQIIGYLLGTSGWAIGLWLGQASKYYAFHTHRILAICIFTFTTLQILSLCFRLKEKDEYRKYWNMYHHFLGYALLSVIAVNIFQGIAILKPQKTWKEAYIGILLVLGAIALSLEIYTWIKFAKDKAQKQMSKDSQKTEEKPKKDKKPENP